MISLLHGTVDSINGSTVTLDVGGVGYEVQCSRRCVEALTCGEQARVVVYTEVKEDSIRLFGFEDRLEKQVFSLLLQVKGVGARSACDIISRIEKKELLRVIGAGDVGQLQAVKGIGKKTAERIVVELKDRVAQHATEESSVSPARGSGLRPFEEAVEALQVLGLSKRDSERAVQSVEKELQSAAGVVKDFDTSQVVKEALRYV